MAVYSYEDLRPHIGHKLACVCYGKKGEDPANIAVECETCHEVLLDFDRIPENPYSANALEEKYDSRKTNYTNEHPLFTRNDWGAEAAQDHTSLSYWSWVENEVEYAVEEAQNLPAEQIPVALGEEPLCPEAKDVLTLRLKEE